MLINKTKIVATIGPSSSSKEVLKQMIEEGLNVCRLNFSHGNHEDHALVVKNIREIDKELRTHTAILGDLQGPKLRIGEVKGGQVELEEGHMIKVTSKEQESTSDTLYVNYNNFAQDVKSGDRVLIDDGKIVLQIDTVTDQAVVAIVLQGGTLSSKKGFNLPNTAISLPCLTEKDREDLKFILEHELSWVGLSFVRSANDIEELRTLIKSAGAHTRIVAKIEKPEAVKDINAIIHAADAIMVARGDLGVEVPLETVPMIQKDIINKARKVAKPTIIATQMMESMINNISPTRAEVSDVANGVTDGADAVMLSGETSVGEYPVEVIKTMYSIITNAESYEGIFYKEKKNKDSAARSLSDAICYSACTLAKQVNAAALITMSFSGYTGFKLASFRPKANVFVFTSNYRILNMLSLIWGVRGFYYDKFVSTDHTIADIKYNLKREGLLRDNDLVINIASMPIAEKGMSNMLKLSYVK